MSKSGKVIRKKVRGRNLRETASPTRGQHGKSTATRKKKKRGNAEHLEQSKFTAFMRTYHNDLLFFAVPNGGYRTASEAGRLKAEGVLAGVADIFVAEPIRMDHDSFIGGLFLEFKAPGKINTQSPAQIQFESRVTEDGYYDYRIVDSAADGVRAVYEYMGPCLDQTHAELLALLENKPG